MCTSSMRLVLRVNEGIPFLGEDLVTKPDKEDIASEKYHRYFWYWLVGVCVGVTYILTVWPVPGYIVAKARSCAATDSGQRRRLVGQTPSCPGSLTSAFSPEKFLDL